MDPRTQDDPNGVRDRVLRDAQLHYLRQQYAGAKALLTAHHEQFPDDPEIESLLARVLASEVAAKMAQTASHESSSPKYRRGAGFAFRKLPDPVVSLIFWGAMFLIVAVGALAPTIPYLRSPGLFGTMPLFTKHGVETVPVLHQVGIALFFGVTGATLAYLGVKKARE
jgi:hypothetical protein